jgi:hypothetical protein
MFDQSRKNGVRCGVAINLQTTRILQKITNTDGGDKVIKHKPAKWPIVTKSATDITRLEDWQPAYVYVNQIGKEPTHRGGEPFQRNISISEVPGRRHCSRMPPERCQSGGGAELLLLTLYS